MDVEDDPTVEKVGSSGVPAKRFTFRGEPKPGLVPDAVPVGMTIEGGGGVDFGKASNG